MVEGPEVAVGVETEGADVEAGAAVEVVVEAER